MTEAEWLACDDPQAMLDLVEHTASARKLRLVACGFCRSVWSEIGAKRSSCAVERAEQYADGTCTRKEMARAGEAARSATRSAWNGGRQKPEALLHRACRDAALADAFDAALCAADAVRRAYEGVTDHERPQAQLLRCVFGPLPFRGVGFDSRWRSPTVHALADGVYEDRAFDRLPILADALEDAGCSDPELLRHLRSPGPHVRGCWALDLVLGKR